MTWDQYAAFAVMAVSGTTAVILILTGRTRKQDSRIHVQVIDQPDGRVVAVIEHGTYRITANRADHEQANAFLRDELARINGEKKP